jgi:hypothetical protein
MTTLEKLELDPAVVRELQTQCVQSVEDLLTLAAQPDERNALLADMHWTERGLQALVEQARRLVRAKPNTGKLDRAAANSAA